MESELEYRPIPGFPGYLARSDGTIWTLLKRIPKSAGKKIQYEISTTRAILSRTKNCDGYFHVKIRGRVKKVCRLMALAFLGTPPQGMECRHLNGISSDDRAENLAWSTHKVNIADKRMHGTHQEGEKHPMHKLTGDLVVAIRREYSSGNITQRELAAKYGVSQGGCIGPLLRRRIWRNIQ